MSRGYQVLSEENYAYFVTCTVIDWLPLFAHDAYRQIILDSLAYLREHKRTLLNAFVVMPTHLHAVLWPDKGVSLSDVLRDFKRFTSRAISKEAIRRQDQLFSGCFQHARLFNRAQDESQYQVWQEGSHSEAIFTLGFARQKIDYIHLNPVRGGLVSRAQDWMYSSAPAYLGGETTYPVTDILDG